MTESKTAARGVDEIVVVHLANLLVDGADGHHGMTDRGMVVARLRDETSPEVIVGTSGKRWRDDGSEVVESTAFLSSMATCDGGNNGSLGQELLP